MPNCNLANLGLQFLLVTATYAICKCCFVPLSRQLAYLFIFSVLVMSNFIFFLNSTQLNSSLIGTVA